MVITCLENVRNANIYELNKLLKVSKTLTLCSLPDTSNIDIKVKTTPDTGGYNALNASTARHKQSHWSSFKRNRVTEYCYNSRPHWDMSPAVGSLCIDASRLSCRCNTVGIPCSYMSRLQTVYADIVFSTHEQIGHKPTIILSTYYTVSQ